MGTDIHGVWQAKQPDGTWTDVASEYDQERHYQLFAVLADVRNGRGFAGVVYGSRIEPIAEPRGLPEDFEIKDDCHPVASLEIHAPHRREYAQKYPDDYADGVWMGDHSHSWLTGAEMLDWYATAPVVTHFGVISREKYDTWEKGTEPEGGYSGGISGPGIVVADENDAIKAEGWTHIRVSWPTQLKEDLSNFFNEVKRLRDAHDTEIRFVFGFDS